MVFSAGNSMQIFKNKPWLAPLAGYSDLPFRLLCREYGCQTACTEMISAKGLVFESPGTKRLLATGPADTPLVVQLFGSEAAYCEQAMKVLLSRGFAYFDLNAGCPVRKVVKTGAGAALLRDPDRLVRLAGGMVDLAGKGRVGVKLRSGWDAASRLQAEVFQELERIGLGWIAVHPRTARQGFSGQADWSFIRAVQDTVAIPVLAGGDLFTAEDGVRCLEQTGAAGVMFARGALNNPMIFSRFRELMDGKAVPSRQAQWQPTDFKTMIFRHMHYCREGQDAGKSLLKMRTIIPRYLKGFPGAKDLRRQIVQAGSWGDLEALIGRIGLGEERNVEHRTLNIE